MTATKTKVSKDRANPRKKGMMPTAAKVRLYATVAMGVWIPLFCGLLSLAGGRLVRGEGVQVFLGLYAFALMVFVLGVSMPHLAWSIGNITRSGPFPSWLLAAAFDLALVLGELVHIYADDDKVGVLWAATTWMLVVSALGMGLNCWAFFKNPHGYKPKSKSRVPGGLWTRLLKALG